MYIPQNFVIESRANNPGLQWSVESRTNYTHDFGIESRTHLPGTLVAF